jgi:hypothetical protein
MVGIKIISDNPEQSNRNHVMKEAKKKKKNKKSKKKEKYRKKIS